MGYYTRFEVHVPDSFEEFIAAELENKKAAEEALTKALEAAKAAGYKVDGVKKENHDWYRVDSERCIIISDYHFYRDKGTSIFRSDEIKFYSSTDDFTALSELFKGLWKVVCTGEDGTKWVEYYKYGGHYSARLVIPEFDESKLEW